MESVVVRQLLSATGTSRQNTEIEWYAEAIGYTDYLGSHCTNGHQESTRTPCGTSLS